VRYINEHQRDAADQPFFLYLAYTAAHWPMQALESDIAKYRGKYDAGYEAIRRARYQRARELGILDKRWELSETAGDWDAVENKAWEARCMEVYAAMIDSMDQGIGRIVETLKATGQLDNTLIMFMQDNGACAETVGRKETAARESKPTLPTIPPDELMQKVIPTQTRDGWPVLGGTAAMPGPADTYIAYGEGWANVSNTPLRRYKHWVHEGGISTPLVVHWPTVIAKDRRNALESQPGHLIDIMATCLDVAGATYPTQRDGQNVLPHAGVSLRPAFDGRSIERGKPIFWEHEGNRAVRDGTWKLVAKHEEPWELYDIDADRSEQHDLAAAEATRRDAMIAQYETWAEACNVALWPVKENSKTKNAAKAK
jgi:arylsulfatase